VHDLENSGHLREGPWCADFVKSLEPVYSAEITRENFGIDAVEKGERITLDWLVDRGIKKASELDLLEEQITPTPLPQTTETLLASSIKTVFTKHSNPTTTLKESKLDSFLKDELSSVFGYNTQTLSSKSMRKLHLFDEKQGSDISLSATTKKGI